MSASQYQSKIHLHAEKAQWDELMEILETLLNQATWTADALSMPFNVSISSIGGGGADSINSLQNQEQLIEALLCAREGPYNWTPIMISAPRAPTDVVALLLQLCPSSCMVADRGGSLPIHSVSSWRKGKDGGDDEQHIISMLLQTKPESVSAQNKWGQTPLHCIFDTNIMPAFKSLEVILGLFDPLVELYERAKVDDDSSIPGDDQMSEEEKEEERQSKESKNKMIKIHVRKALSMPDSKGRLPLHIAASKGASTDVLRLLVNLYPLAATVSAKGDLPVHLLHYWAEDMVDLLAAEKERAKEDEREMRNPFDKSDTVLNKNIFDVVSVRQIEALLEPLCIGYMSLITRNETKVVKVKNDGRMKVILEQDEDETDGDDKLVDIISLTTESSKLSSVINCNGLITSVLEAALAAEVACSVPGTRQKHLPIHLAAKHGVSFNILDYLCQQYPEGIGTPQLVRSVDKVCDNGTDQETKNDSASSIYSIEIFESGRAGMEAMVIAHFQNSLIEQIKADPFSESSTDALISINKHTVALQTFVRRSDLLFSYYPEATPMQYNCDNSENNNITSPVHHKNRHIHLYRRDYERISRLESLIRTDAASANSDLSASTRILFLWMCHYAGPTKKDTYQASIGRIINNLSQNALRKLSRSAYSSVNKDQRIIQASGLGTFCSESLTFNSKDLLGRESQADALAQHLIQLPNGRTIQEEAQVRAAGLTMDQLLSKNEQNNWNYVLTSFLSNYDGISYSATCKKTRALGLRLLSEMSLVKTEKNWNSNEEINSNFWQTIDDVLVTPSCTHTVYVMYYVGFKTSNDFYLQGSSNSMDTSTLATESGGLRVVSKNNLQVPTANTSLATEGAYGGEIIEEIEKRRVATENGYEIRLSFKYLAGRSYSLRYYCAPDMGHISVSNARVRQLVHASDQDGRTPLHVLLSYNDMISYPSLRIQVSMLLASKFGSSDAAGDVPLHYALKCGVSEEVLRELIEANPSSLVETDQEGRTPLHAAFLLSGNDPPSTGVIKALLSTPGENATKLKDSAGRLPLHIAAERGANEAVLWLLVEAYTDGCYRQNKDGDLPVHLLVRTGMASTSTVELLIRPFMDNETICRFSGSQGTCLPLHLAAEYNCSYKLLERLLSTCRGAACIARQRINSDGSRESPIYALDIFENLKHKMFPPSKIQEDSDHIAQKEKATIRKSSLNEFSIEDAPKTTWFKGEVESRTTVSAMESAQMEMTLADFDLRSDALFVYNPLLTVHSTKGTTNPVAYRKDKKRMKRLENLVRREAIQCFEKRKVQKDIELTEMAKLAWCFICTFKNANNPLDQYVESVRNVLHGLPTSVVQILSEVPNILSYPNPNILLKDCAAPACKQLIRRQIQFVGRYLLDKTGIPIHKTDSCLVMGAKDFGAVESYEDVMSLFQNEEDPDIDDLCSISAESVETLKVPTVDPLLIFSKFVTKIGLNRKNAILELKSILESQTEIPQETVSLNGSENYYKLSQNPENSTEERGQTDDITLEAFQEFCKCHLISKSGTQNVVIKFMKNELQFQRELSSRIRLNSSATNWSIVPIIESYNIDRIHETSQQENQDANLLEKNDLMDNKDALYYMDIQEKNISVHNFCLYKYALVMPRGDKDLHEIFCHEDLGILQIREYTKKICVALEELHKVSIIHCDLKMANIVRYGLNLALTDLDSAIFSNRSEVTSSEKERIDRGFYKFSSGILPPEMIAKIDLTSNRHDIEQYETYWKDEVTDFRDLKLLTPDDIQTITLVVKSLSGRSEVFPNMNSSLKSLRNSMKEPIAGLEDPCEDWKDILSTALISITFDDLPSSLTSCASLEEFVNTWSRLQTNSRLWERIKPRKDATGQYAFIVKCFDELRGNANGTISGSKLPYDIVLPSKKSDIWAFGVLLFTMCTGISLFHVSSNGDLQDTNDFKRLHNWNLKDATKVIVKYVDDPLAQDLLTQLLVEEHKRLDSMERVLNHPFFGPTLGIQAQRMLEKYEEEQLIIEETVTIERLRIKKSMRINLSMENHCRIVFEEEKIVVPTCFIVLPYALQWNETNQLLETPGDVKTIGYSVKVGKCLLDINQTTAKLSFWLKLKEKLHKHGDFKVKMKEWLIRARNEESYVVANEIINAIGCDREYRGVCIEMLEEGDHISNAKSFIKDSMRSARLLIKKSTERLSKYYSSQYFYLVDEFCGVPTLSCVDGKVTDDKYPINVAPDLNLFENIFLPLMNLTVMTCTAFHGMKGLARLLGIPQSLGIPDKWSEAQIGLIHSPSKPSTIVEFAVLQDVMQRQDKSLSFQESSTGGDYDHSQSARSHVMSIIDKGDSSVKSSNSHISCNTEKSESVMNKLEIFLRKYDPLRCFSNLQRVCERREDSSALWTTHKTIEVMINEVEVANLEGRLYTLKKELETKNELEQEIAILSNQIKCCNIGQEKNNISNRKVSSIVGKSLDNASTPLVKKVVPSLVKKTKHPPARRHIYKTNPQSNQHVLNQKINDRSINTNTNT